MLLRCEYSSAFSSFSTCVVSALRRHSVLNMAECFPVRVADMTHANILVRVAPHGRVVDLWRRNILNEIYLYGVTSHLSISVSIRRTFGNFGGKLKSAFIASFWICT